MISSVLDIVELAQAKEGQDIVPSDNNMGSLRTTTLRHKLDALSFNEPFEEMSIPLIERLIEHIVQSTESYRQLTLQATSKNQQLDEYETKVRVFAHVARG